MKLIFVDETSDSKFKDYFGICISIFDSASYKIIKDKFQAILRDSKWDEKIEFKGSFIFSAKKGDLKISIPDRIAMAEKLIDLNIASKNARISFSYGVDNNSGNKRESYLVSVPSFLKKVLPSAPSGGKGKDLLLICCDHRDDVKSEEIHELIEPIIKEKGYTLVERVVMCKSGFHTIGILLTDIVCYLSGRIDVISNDAELFENIPKEEFANNGKIKHLLTSKELLRKVKNIKIYQRKLISVKKSSIKK